MDKFSALGVSRHRIGTDGQGVTTLVAGLGCPLSCSYCLNPKCKTVKGKSFSVEELFEEVSIDSLYFEATNGGITFGGGEPLLQAEFVRSFIELARSQGKSWRFTLESSAAVPPEKLRLLDNYIDTYFIDCKDLNPKIYRKYTGCSPDFTYNNITYLAEKFPEKLIVRVPLIPGFNSEEDCDFSEKLLRESGVREIDRFTYQTENPD